MLHRNDLPNHFIFLSFLWLSASPKPHWDTRGKGPTKVRSHPLGSLSDYSSFPKISILKLLRYLGPHISDESTLPSRKSLIYWSFVYLSKSVSLTKHCHYGHFPYPLHAHVVSPSAANHLLAALEAGRCTAGAWIAPPAYPDLWPSQSVSQRLLISFPCQWPHQMRLQGLRLGKSGCDAFRPWGSLAVTDVKRREVKQRRRRRPAPGAE